MYHEQLVRHILQSNTKINVHNDDDNVNDGDKHDIIIMLAYIQFTCTYYGSIGQHTHTFIYINIVSIY